MIKNLLLGGADFNTPSDRVKPTDLNDTFDAAARFQIIFGRMFKNQAQLIFNADLIGLDGALDEEYENLKRDVLSTNADIDSTNSEIKEIPVYGAEVMDDFEDSSIDAGIWSTSGTVTESGGQLHVTSTGGGTSYAVADGVSAQDFNRVGTVFLDATAVHSVGGTSYIRLQDESANFVNLKVIHSGSGGTFATSLRMEVEPGSNNVQVYTNIAGTGGGTAVDVTSLTDGDEWHISIQTNTGGGDTVTINTEFVRYLENVVSKDFISTETTASETITDAILVVNKTINGTSSATYWLSADNGTNYEEVNLNELHKFTNTGTQLKVKVTMTNDASDNVYELNHYAVWYNIGTS